MFHFLEISADAADWSGVLPEGARLTRQNLTARAELCTLDAGVGTGDVLIAPPVSGHAGTLLLDTVRGLLAHTRVHVVEMTPPDQLPADLGEGGFSDQVCAITSALRLIGSAHLIGACQSTAASLEAAARISRTESDRLLSLTLLAAPLVEAPGTGGVADHVPDRGTDALADFLGRIEGLVKEHRNGQAALPGDIQLAAILGGSGGAARILMEESCTAWSFAVGADRRRRARDRTRILSRSVSIERGLLIEALKKNFVNRPHARAGGAAGRIACPVHLVAAERDRVIPAAQTIDGANLFDEAPVETTIVEAADHFDLFCGEGAMQLGHTLGRKISDADIAPLGRKK